MKAPARRDESGATAIIVAISLVAIFAMAMLAIDAGLLWRQRRIVTTATDAGALSEARLAAISAPFVSTSCSNTWQSLVDSNGGPDVSPVSCTVNPVTSSAGVGYVQVDAKIASPVVFGKAIGMSDQAPESVSVARYGFVTAVKGLRPIGLCIAGPHIQQWLAFENGSMSSASYNALRGSGPEYPIYPGEGVVHRIIFSNSSPNSCGSTSGNWGWTDFQGGSKSDAVLVDWLIHGYNANRVGIGDCNADDSTPGEPCAGFPGSRGGSVDAALSSVTGSTFAVPVFDSVSDNGANVNYNIAAFLGVKLMGFLDTGPQANRYFDFEFTNVILTGNCCTDTSLGPDTGVRSVRLCSVDHDPVSASQRCS